jgi:hypothetical protein
MTTSIMDSFVEAIYSLFYGSDIETAFTKVGNYDYIPPNNDLLIDTTSTLYMLINRELNDSTTFHSFFGDDLKEKMIKNYLAKKRGEALVQMESAVDDYARRKIDGLYSIGLHVHTCLPNAACKLITEKEIQARLKQPRY